MTEFRIQFKSEIKKDETPWDIGLHTTESYSNRDIKDLILKYVNEIKNATGDYSPVTIMDAIVRDHRGWDWYDGDYYDIHINNY